MKSAVQLPLFRGYPPQYAETATTNEGPKTATFQECPEGYMCVVWALTIPLWIQNHHKRQQRCWFQRIGYVGGSADHLSHCVDRQDCAAFEDGSESRKPNLGRLGRVSNEDRVIGLTPHRKTTDIPEFAHFWLYQIHSTKSYQKKTRQANPDFVNFKKSVFTCWMQAKRRVMPTDRQPIFCLQDRNKDRIQVINFGEKKFSLPQSKAFISEIF